MLGVIACSTVSRPKRASTATSTPPPWGAVARMAIQRGLVRGIHPLGWMADVEYVPSGENRSHGSSLGSKLRRFCNGTRFRYVFR